MRKQLSIPLVTLLAFTNLCAAATYYVDFNGGADSNPGTSPTSAFKHCPGDPTSQHKIKLQPGDVVIFKGGVSYRGSVEVKDSGSKEKPIIFDGNTDGKFGTGKAIIEGADPMTGWKKCASAKEAKDNPLWSQIYYLDVPRPRAWNALNLCDAEKALPIAQQPNPKDPFFQEFPEDYNYTKEPLKVALTLRVTGQNLAEDKTRPLMLMLLKKPPISAVISPLAGGCFDIELPKATAITSVGIAPQPKYTPVKEVAFYGDGKELLKVTLQKEKPEIQKFQLPSPVTISKLSVKLLSPYDPADKNFTAIRQVAAYTADGTNILAIDPPAMTLTDPQNLTMSDPHYFDGVTFAFHGNHNNIVYVPVRGFDPAAHRLDIEAFVGELYKETRYSFFNSVRFIDQPGEYSVEELPDPKMSRVFLLPQKVKDNQPDDIGAAGRSVGIGITDASNIVVQGFAVRRQNKQGLSASGSGSNIVFRDCEVSLVRGDNGIGQSHIDDAVVERCYVHHNPGHTRGIVLHTCTNSVVRDCKIEKNSATGLDFYTCTGCKMTGNTVLGNRGMHANGLTLYVGCKDSLVEGNYVAGGWAALTFQQTENIIIRNNVFDANNDAQGVGIWPTQPLKNIQILNNCMLHSDPNHDWCTGLFSNGRSIEGLVVKNNIIDGLCSDFKVFKNANFSNNIYTRIGPDQKDGMLGKDEKTELDLKKIFVDPDKGDFHLKPGSPAIGTGVDVGLEQDMDGKKLPKGRAPDIGPYQFHDNE